MICDN